MTIEKLKSRRKIGIIFMPVNEIRPPVSLTTYGSAGDLVMDEIARRLARSHDVVAYCARGEDQQKVEQCDGVEYRRMSTSIDRWFFSRYPKIMRLIGMVYRRNAMQPIFSSPLWYRQFIAEVTADPALQDCDIVHIMNLSQFVPFIRARVPKARIVLHMHCQWLEEFDAAVIARRIYAADLVLGVSNFIASGVRRRFPSFSERCSHIYNGADIALFARPAGVLPRPKQLLYVGRLAPEKGVHILLDAFQIVLAHHPDAHPELIGQERVFLTPCDLDRLSTVIRCEVGGRNDDLKAAFRFLAHAIWLLIFCAVLSLLASALTGPLFAYPWSN